MLPIYYWWMPWVIAARWAAIMIPQPSMRAPQPSAQIIPFPIRRSASA